MQPGASQYVITARTGGAYRLVWIGSGTQPTPNHEFFGSVWTAGHFTTEVPGCVDGSCQVTSGTIGTPVNLTGGGQRIDFDTVTGAQLNGFDFVVDTEPVYFDLFIDGVRQPTMVFFPASGSGQTSIPGVLPFALTPL